MNRRKLSVPEQAEGRSYMSQRAVRSQNVPGEGSRRRRNQQNICQTRRSTSQLLYVYRLPLCCGLSMTTPFTDKRI